MRVVVMVSNHMRENIVTSLGNKCYNENESILND